MNVILHTLAHISPFRDYFLREDNYLSITPPPGDQTFTLGKRNNIIQGFHKGVRDVTSHHSAGVPPPLEFYHLTIIVTHNLKNSYAQKKFYMKCNAPLLCVLIILFLLSFFVVHRLGELFRKLWNPRYFLFRAHVSPHEMLQAVSSVSKKRFKIVEQGKYICIHMCIWLYAVTV